MINIEKDLLKNLLNQDRKNGRNRNKGINLLMSFYILKVILYQLHKKLNNQPNLE